MDRECEQIGRREMRAFAWGSHILPKCFGSHNGNIVSPGHMLCVMIPLDGQVQYTFRNKVCMAS